MEMKEFVRAAIKKVGQKVRDGSLDKPKKDTAIRRKCFWIGSGSN